MRPINARRPELVSDELRPPQPLRFAVLDAGELQLPAGALRRSFGRRESETRTSPPSLALPAMSRGSTPVSLTRVDPSLTFPLTH